MHPLSTKSKRTTSGQTRLEQAAPLNAATSTNLALLALLLGEEEARLRYRGSLHPFFATGPSGRLSDACAVAGELVKRWLHEQLQEREAFATASVAKDYLRLHFAGYEREVFVVMYLDTQLRLIEVEEISLGGLQQSALYPREFVKGALRRNAACVILAHNHPSGHCEPSASDVQVTVALRQALGLIDVRVLDHIIVGADECVSLGERGLL